jgi:hypothetical protein
LGEHLILGNHHAVELILPNARVEQLLPLLCGRRTTRTKAQKSSERQDQNRLFRLHERSISLVLNGVAQNMSMADTKMAAPLVSTLK